MNANRINQAMLDEQIWKYRGIFVVADGALGIAYNPVSHKFKFLDNNGNIETLIRELSGEPNFENPKISKYRIEVTEACDANCKYCLVYQNPVINKGDMTALKKGNMQYRSMPVNIAEGIVERFNTEVGTQGSIMIIGGEPLVNWPATRVFLERSLSRVNIYTNGMGITDKIADFIAEHSARVYLSLDGGDSYSNRLRILNDGREMFYLVLNSYSKLKERNVPIAINSVITDDNVNDLEKHARFFVDQLGCKTMGLAHPHYTAFTTIALDISKYVSQMCYLFGFAKKNDVFIDQIAKRLQPIISGNYRLIGCRLAGEQRTFKPDGTETLCTKLDSNDATRKISLNDIQEKLPLYSDYCHEKCIAEGSCGGGCYFDGRMLGHDMPVDERECRISIGIVTTILKDMLQEHKERGIKTREEFQQIYAPMLAAFK